METTPETIAYKGPLLVVAWLVVAAGCQTTDPASSVKTKDGAIYVLVGHDERSATPRPYSKGFLKELTQRVRARAKKPDGNAASQVALAQLALTGGDLSKAREHARRALAIDFRDRDAKIVVAHVAYLERRFEEAGALLGQLGGEDAKESEILTLLGCLAWVDGDSRRAEATLAKAVGVNGDDVAARMNLGILFLLRENYAGAQGEFHEVLRRIPGNVDARIHLGITYARQGKLADAQAAYREAEKAGAEKNPLLLYNLAVAEKRAGKFDDALKTTKRLLEVRRLTVSEQEQVLALLDDIRIEREVARQGASDAEIEELIADAREKIKSGGAADEDRVVDENLGTVVGH